MRKLGQVVSEKNVEKMREVVRLKIEGYVRQLSKGIRSMEKQRNYFVRQDVSRGRTWPLIKSDGD